MKKKVKNKPQPNATEHRQGITRRDFLTRAGVSGAAVVATAGGLIGWSTPSNTTGATFETSAKFAAQAATPTPSPAQATCRVTDELPIPTKVAGPTTSEYQCDVLVVGGGFAGLNAAVSAKTAGKSVVLVDKGRPGYSGLSPWVSSHRWIDTNLGDVPEAYRQAIQIGGEYITNLDWLQVWIDDSKKTYERLMNWEILKQYPKASKAGDYVAKNDFVGYREKFDQYDRRAKFIKVLDDNGIKYVERTMITDVIKQDGKVVGAMGFDVPSGTVLTFHAKAVILCSGGWSYKPSGFPTSGNTFDGEYIGYHLGLPIISKEFDDFHTTVSRAAGNSFLNNNWTYLENIWLCGGDITPKGAVDYAAGKGNMVLGRVNAALKGLANDDGTAVEDLSKADPGRKGGTVTGNPNDPRTGKDNDTMPKGDAYGAAIGMCAHLTSGIFCGLRDLVGDTGLPGLYVGGDGANASMSTGAAYSNGVGFTSSFCSIQGWRAGEAAAKYADGVPLTRISADTIASVTKNMQAPLSLTTGLDPNWARDVLQAIMAPYWIHIVKTDATLNGALAQVEYIRNEVVPKLMAKSSHDLRLCHEMKHKVLSAEMKLRAGLARKESRGYHYRADYPFRDDKNFLCYIALQKGSGDSMTVSKIDIKDEWKGDLTQKYADRYKYQFPGEAKAMGL